LEEITFPATAVRKRGEKRPAQRFGEDYMKCLNRAGKGTERVRGKNLKEPERRKRGDGEEHSPRLVLLKIRKVPRSQGNKGKKGVGGRAFEIVPTSKKLKFSVNAEITTLEKKPGEGHSTLRRSIDLDRRGKQKVGRGGGI